jgi:hypothetical protein
VRERARLLEEEETVIDLVLKGLHPEEADPSVPSTPVQADPRRCGSVLAEWVGRGVRWRGWDSPRLEIPLLVVLLEAMAHEGVGGVETALLADAEVARGFLEAMVSDRNRDGGGALPDSGAVRGVAQEWAGVWRRAYELEQGDFLPAQRRALLLEGELRMRSLLLPLLPPDQAAAWGRKPLWGTYYERPLHRIRIPKGEIDDASFVHAWDGLGLDLTSSEVERLRQVVGRFAPTAPPLPVLESPVEEGDVDRWLEAALTQARWQSELEQAIWIELSGSGRKVFLSLGGFYVTTD